MESRFNWLICPVCGGKTKVHVLENTVLQNFPLFCTRCKNQSVVNVQELQMETVGEPVAAARTS